MSAEALGSHGQFTPRLNAGVQLGEYVLGHPLWRTRVADVYRANGPGGPSAIHVIHPALSQHGPVRDAIIAGARTTAALAENRHRVRTLAAGLTGEVLWIATEEVDGTLVRDMLIKKRQGGTSGFGARGAGNLVTGIAHGLTDAVHGALSTESMTVSRRGRVRIVDLALGPATLAAMQAGLIEVQSSVAPELQSGGPASGEGDVYAIGALLYESLVGIPLTRGGARPSEVVQGVTAQIDQIVARACHKDPRQRFSRVDVLGEVVGEALGKGGGISTTALPALERAASLEEHAQKVTSNSDVAATATATAPTPTTIAASGNHVVDRALAAALSDSAEKWLVTKGRLDYGPFSLADVVAQIDKGDIVSSNIITDKDTGSRGSVGDHPLLGPVVEAARQRIDDARRAQAEVKVQSHEKRRGLLLYGVIGLGLLGAVVAVYFIVHAVRSDDTAKTGIGISKLEGGDLKVSVSMPKKPPAKHRPGGGGKRPTGGNANGGPGGGMTDTLSLDLSDDSDETETLGMDKVYATYASRGSQLGGCLQATGSNAANIGIIISGPSGRVTWVKVNGQQSGALFNCISRVMRGLQFPTINGPRTRAEFDINL